MLLSRPLLGERSLVIPLAWVLLVVVEGYDGLGRPHAWAPLPGQKAHLPALRPAPRTHQESPSHQRIRW